MTRADFVERIESLGFSRAGGFVRDEFTRGPVRVWANTSCAAVFSGEISSGWVSFEEALADVEGPHPEGGPSELTAREWTWTKRAVGAAAVASAGLSLLLAAGAAWAAWDGRRHLAAADAALAVVAAWNARLWWAYVGSWRRRPR